MSAFSKFMKLFSMAGGVRSKRDPVTGGIDFFVAGSNVEITNGNASKKTIVIFGSSNGAGVGASDYYGEPSSSNGWASPPHSWAGLLKSALGSDWKVINRSQSGTGVAAGVARFWTDVAPHRPSHVIICNHPCNDGFDYRSVLQNTKTLIRYCDLIGAIPILRGAYMYPAMSAAVYAQSLSFNQQLDQLGRHRIDHFSTLDDGAGSFVNAAFHAGDGLHPSDSGYYQLFKAIDLNIFRYGESRVREVKSQSSAWKVNADAVGSGIMVKSIDLNTGSLEPLSSWTMRARIKGALGAPGGRAFMSAHMTQDGSDTAWRLRNPANTLELISSDGTSISSAANVTVGDAIFDVVVRYNAATGVMSLFINAVLIGTATPVGVNERGVFVFGGRGDAGATASGYSFSDCAIWNVALSNLAIEDAYLTGKIQQAGLIFAADFRSKPQPAGIVPNAVENAMMGYLGSAIWSRTLSF